MMADSLVHADTAERRANLAATGASGAWDWDIVANRLYVDPLFAELYGLDPALTASSLPTSIFYKAIHPEDRARMRIAVAGMLGGAELFSKEFRVIAPDGSVLWMHGRGRAQLDADDRPIRFTGLLVDVTERKRTEERLRIAQTAGGIGTFEYTDGFATVAVSDEFCRLLGFHPATALPVPTINNVVIDGDTPLIPHAVNGQVPENLEANYRIRRADDGSERWIARRGEIVREGLGYRVVGVIYDITDAKEQEARLRELNDTLEMRVEQEVAERRMAEEALRQAQKMESIGQLTGGIAHDFNNLLMAVLSSLELLRKRVGEDPYVTRLLENSTKAAERGAALTQRMLAFARRQELTAEPVEIPQLVSGIMDLLRGSLGPSYTVETAFPADLSCVVTDVNQLEMALLNLAVNARDAMPNGGPITIVATERDILVGEVGDLGSGRYVRLTVADRGTGMDARTLARASEPFFTTKGIGKGTGLGLSMVHGFAHQLGGAFELESELGAGTRAHIWLPACVRNDPAEANQDEPQSEPETGRPLTIMTVDDDLLVLMNTAALLEDLGHTVLEANTGEEALALLGSGMEIDLLITDHAMPGMTGRELITAARADRPDLPVLLATGYGETPLDGGLAVPRLQKPFGQSDLQRAIASALR